MPRPSLTTCKPAYELTPLEVLTFPMWEYVLDEMSYDETYVKPLDGTHIPNETLVHVRAEFQTAYGRKLLGVMEAWPHDGIREYRFPYIFVGDSAPSVDPPGEESADYNRQQFLRDLETGLQQPIEKIYPIQWRLYVAHEGETEPPTGTLELPAWVKTWVKKR